MRIKCSKLNIYLNRRLYLCFLFHILFCYSFFVYNNILVSGDERNSGVYKAEKKPMNRENKVM